MKKKLLMLLLIIGFSVQLFSQVLFDFSVDIKSKVIDGKTVADVEVVLKTGEIPVNYQIMPVEQLDGTPVMESGMTKEKKYKFNNVPAGKYLMKIIDEQKRSAFQLIIINEE